MQVIGLPDVWSVRSKEIGRNADLLREEFLSRFFAIAGYILSV